jgi:hypothetical protein
MRKQILIIIVVIHGLCSKGFSQPAAAMMQIDTTSQSVAYWQHWMKELNEQGVEKKSDSFYVKEEVVKLLKDPDYRKMVYPDVYNWQATVSLLNRMELKKAFWQMINLYQTDTAHRNIVIGTFVLYDSLMDMDKILLNTFYTYAFTDPDVCRISNNKPDIFRPDLLEQKLRTTREIVSYIWMSRKEKKNKKQ